MVKFQSDFFCLHVIMFSLNQAALLFIQLLLTYQVFAVLGTHPFDHRDVLVSRGDSVMFTCNISNANTTQINWTKEISPSWYFLYMLTPAIGFLLCGFTPAVCLCRKLRTRTPNQNPVQDQFHLQSEGEVVLRQPQGGTDSRTNNQQRSQYMERVNSIYGL
ncbi:uncharacterized protein LOC122886145 isoform X5 [Siniperca chuatsi]|uniref:uncharacterized protein LOC122886145 isoform X5 n=1 Tax=Siniperca chuatsi TaxID=119488 RepID=UPI001CE029A0|nr:uncharacterized protein LOC122886145 isoform X5 [Siniperca chuatsi]